jgi:hypothetical protein
MKQWWMLVGLVACGNSSSSAPDAAAEVDGDLEVDAAVDAALPVTCSGSVCQTGQTCVENKCTYSCAGNTVPGDYSSLQTAVTALAAADQDATICVGEATFNENGTLSIYDGGNHGKSLTIVGLSPERSKIFARVSIGSGWSSITLQGIGFSPPASYYAIESFAMNTTVSLIGSKINGAGGVQIYQKANWLIEGTDITAGSEAAVNAYANTSGPLVVRVVNSYLHGAGLGVYATGTGQIVQLDVVNSTLAEEQIGVDLLGSVTALIANNLITGMTEHALSWTSSATVTRHHNALWANAANYSGLGSDGANTLKVDCMLGSQTVPELASGSPCLGVGDAAIAPSHDYFGLIRGASPDLGAVERP